MSNSWISRPIRIRNAKTVFILLMVLAAVIYFAALQRKKPKPVCHAPNSIKCFDSKDDSLSDITSANPAKDKSIFFLETSCTSAVHGKIVITSRQACAVESAARLNRNLEIYLLYASPGLIINEGTQSDNFIEAILSYKNVKIHHLDPEPYVRDTIVEGLFIQGKIKNSYYPVSHASDVLRYLTLWKYGGIYLDLDVIVIKSLEDLPLNYAGALNKEIVASGVLSFKHDGIGHNLSTRCLEDLRRNFNKTSWINNGAGVITRLAREICGTSETSEMGKRECAKYFSVYPVEAFYAVDLTRLVKYFNKDPNNKVRNWTRDSYIVHSWNRVTTLIDLEIDDDVPFIHFAEEYCPRVFSKCREVF